MTQFVAETVDPTGFRQSWAIQRRVIGALLMREILTRYGRHNIGFLWLFVEPMIFTLGVTALWTATRTLHGSDLPIVAFAISGYSCVLLWRNMPSRCIDAIEPNLSLMYHRNVKIIDIFLSRILLEGMGATISLVTLTIAFTAIEWMVFPVDVLQVAAGWLMLAWFGTALAILLGSLAEQSQTVEKIWHPASYFLFPLSGSAFLVDALPVQAQEFLLFFPMVHAAEFIREGFFGARVVAHYDMGYMASVNLALTLLGLAQLRKISKTITPE